MIVMAGRGDSQGNRVERGWEYLQQVKMVMGEEMVVIGQINECVIEEVVEMQKLEMKM